MVYSFSEMPKASDFDRVLVPYVYGDFTSMMQTVRQNPITTYALFTPACGFTPVHAGMSDKDAERMLDIMREVYSLHLLSLSKVGALTEYPIMSAAYAMEALENLAVAAAFYRSIPNPAAARVAETSLAGTLTRNTPPAGIDHSL